MKKILLPTDYSSNSVNALAYALNFAKEVKGTVNILHLLENSKTERLPFLKSPATKTTVNELPDSQLTNCVKLALDSKVLHAPETNTLSFELGCGYVASEIRQRSKDYDYIVIGKKGKNSLSERLFGGVTTGVLAGADCPVLVVPEKAVHKKLKNLLFAINYQSVTTEAVHNIITFAERYKAIIHFVHVSTNSKDDEDINESLLEEILTMSKMPKVSFEIVILEPTANVKKALGNYVKENNIDLIAMVNSNKSIFKSLFVESTTRAMSYSTEIPLLSFPGK